MKTRFSWEWKRSFSNLFGLGYIGNTHLFLAIVHNYVLLIFLILVLFFEDSIYSFDRKTAREGTQAGWERSRLLAEQGARCRPQSQDLGIMTWAEGRCLTTEPPRCPYVLFISFISETSIQGLLYTGSWLDMALKWIGQTHP